LKRGVTLLICLILLGGLIGTYFYLDKHPAATETPSATPDKTVKLIEKQKWDVQSIKFLSNNNAMTVLPVILPSPTPRPTPTPPPEGSTPTPTPSQTPTPSPTPTPNISFTVSGFENMALNQSSVDDMARVAYALSASEKLSDNGNPKDFGLDPPAGQIDIKYTDGTDKTLYVGMQTPAKDYYYMMVKGDPAIYMVGTSIGARAFYSADNILDKTLPAISADTIEYVYVKLKGKTPIEFAFDGTQEELDKAMQQYGGVVLNMTTPYKGWELYGSNFKTYVLDGMNGISIGDMAEANPADYAVYGLDDPSLIFWLKDVNGEIHLEIGNDANKADLKSTQAPNPSASEDNKTYVYVKFADYPAVYTMDKSYLSTLYDINIFKFTQRFVELANIDKVDAIQIRSASTNYDITLNHEYIAVTATPTPTSTPVPTPEPGASEQPAAGPEPTSTPGPTPTPENVIHPKVNSQDVQEKAFRTFYQAVIGLSYDVGIDKFTPSGPPDVTITYKFNNGDADVVTRYYKYNNDFYATQKNDDPIEFVVSKQYVDSMFQSAIDLLAGKLDKS